MNKKDNVSTDLVSKSLLESWQRFGYVSAFDFEIFEGTAVFKSYADTAAFNYAFAAKELNANTPNHIEEYFGATPFCWIVEDSHLGSQSLIKERGFSLEETWTGMILDLSQLQDISIPNVEVILVDDTQRLNHWIEVAAKGFEISATSVETFAKPLASFNDQRFFVAYVEGDLASACLVTLCRSAAFLAYVTTIPEMRRRGSGRAVSAFSLADAQTQGFRQAALQASEMGENVYRSLGFKEASRYQLWRKNSGG